MTVADLAIWVIEPSSTQRRIIEGHLEALGISKTQWFKNGQSALNDMHQFQPDLVISAMHLPDMTGTELVQAMRDDQAIEAIPFMLVSSETSDYYLEPIRQAGVIAMLPKPFQGEDLKRALYSTLDFITPDHEALADVVLDDLKVLVVDDSKTARSHIKRVLTNLGMDDITEAVDGRKAIEQLQQQFFDLIVTDYNMPEMDGKELTTYVREKSNQRSIPILMVTSEANNSYLSGIKQSGVSAMCDKPFDPATVKAMISKILTT
ncbi:MAG: response regulator [Gammaproteobacteria bacterium]|nr:response regulator [Gammaproteobacteria bacterium]